jgi:hypothetical protein
MPVKIKPQVSPTGLCKWNLPESTLSVVWLGPGSHLALCHDVPGGLMTSINSRGSDGRYMTRKDAQAAVETFIRRAEEQ